MDSALTNEPIAQTEVTVTGIDPDFIILEIRTIQERIFWPKSYVNQSLVENIQIGDQLMIELKPHSLNSIKNIVEKAKQTSNDQDFESKRHLLEKLIN